MTITSSTRTTLVTAVAGLLLLPPGLAAATPAVATGHAASVTPTPVPTDAELQQRLDDVVAAGATGMVLRLDDGRGTIRLASGDARLSPRVAMRPDVQLRAGSVTKTFVATLVLQAAREHRLSLDDSVGDWLPGLVPHGSRITLRELLNHTSGLFDVIKDKRFFQAVFRHPLHHYTPRQLIHIATRHSPVFAPGTGWGYSNTDYVLLGLVLERATHSSVSTLVRQRITRPLGLRHTFLPARSPRLPAFHAHGYLPPSLTGNGYVDITRISPTALSFAGALVSTPDDLRHFYRALLGGRLLRPAELAQMRTTVKAGPGYRYGLGLYRQKTPCGWVWGHDGNAPGYETFAWNDSSGRRGFVLSVTTQPDGSIQPAENAAITAAACRMLAHP